MDVVKVLTTTEQDCRCCLGGVASTRARGEGTVPLWSGVTSIEYELAGAGWVHGES